MVLSIVGPQSSGKSLLLNTLFGAQFLSSAGRCTRGIYGCLLDIKGSEKFKKILILDTEGI
jgi:GTPase Era involved in 16S rRNA processing